ncbi:hypothetical protein HK102_000652 [Quaeritorhiza haematococci]|nr:hypothetical protein HK102_000652 [Quaeritorhiza haematococci]
MDKNQKSEASTIASNSSTTAPPTITVKFPASLKRKRSFDDNGDNTKDRNARQAENGPGQDRSQQGGNQHRNHGHNRHGHPALPPCDLNPVAITYVCRGPTIPGKFNPEAALTLGVKRGPEFGKLAKGQTVTTASGRVVHPRECVGESRPGALFIIVDCPSPDYIESLISSNEKIFAPFYVRDGMKSEGATSESVQCVVHFLGEGVLEDQRYLDWIGQFGDNTVHVLGSARHSPYTQVNRAQTKIQHRLHILDSSVFPVPFASPSALESSKSYPKMLFNAEIDAQNQQTLPPTIRENMVLAQPLLTYLIEPPLPNERFRRERLDWAACPEPVRKPVTMAMQSLKEMCVDVDGSKAEEVPTREQKGVGQTDGQTEDASLGQFWKERLAQMEITQKNEVKLLTFDNDQSSSVTESSTPALESQSAGAEQKPPSIEQKSKAKSEPQKGDVKSQTHPAAQKPDSNKPKTSPGFHSFLETVPRICSPKPDYADVPMQENTSKGEGKAEPSREDEEALRKTIIVPLGTGAAIPGKYRNVSSTLLLLPVSSNSTEPNTTSLAPQYNDYATVLLDAGEGTLGQLYKHFGPPGSTSASRITPSDTKFNTVAADRMDVDVDVEEGGEGDEVIKRLRLLFVSHMHADHHLGAFRILKRWAMLTNPSSTATDEAPLLTIIAPTHFWTWMSEYGCIEQVFGCTGSSMPASDVLKNGVGRIGRVVFIDSEFVRWSVGCDEKAIGRNVHRFSGDARPSTNLIGAGQGASLLIHEATFEEDMVQEAMDKKHSTTREAVEVALGMNARRLLLTHFSQRYPKIPVIPSISKSQPQSQASALSENAKGDAMDTDSAGKPKTETAMDASKSESGTSPTTSAPNQMGSNQSNTTASQPELMVGIAFDLMRIRLSEFGKLRSHVPALRALFSDEEAGEGDEFKTISGDRY